LRECAGAAEGRHGARLFGLRLRLTLGAIFLLLGGLSLGLPEDGVGPLLWLEHDVLAVA
jgi:hypothetical protein